MWGVEIAAEVAVVTLDAPDRQNHVPVDTVPLFDGGECAVVFFQVCLAVLDPLRVDQKGHVIPDFGLVLGLGRREPDDLLVKGCT